MFLVLATQHNKSRDKFTPHLAWSMPDISVTCHLCCW